MAILICRGMNFNEFLLSLNEIKMKNFATGLLCFTAGVALTLFFTSMRGKKLIGELANLTGDAPVSEEELAAAVNRVEAKFNESN